MTFRKQNPWLFRLTTAGILLALTALGLMAALAKEAPAAAAEASTMHPTFALLDAQGINVLESGAALSTMQTCGQCHDSAYIESHSFHADLGLSEMQGAGGGAEGFDLSSGAFGQWDPLTYRRLSAAGDERLDLSTAEWIMTVGLRHAGGGPAVTSRGGEALDTLSARAGDPETSILDGQTGKPVAWDWDESGTIEMNCFLCHTPAPDNAARTTSIEAGKFGWANTMTLTGTGLFTRLASDSVQWNTTAFDEDGELLEEFVFIQEPTNTNCAQCHGMVHTDGTPLTLTGCSLDDPQSATTGQVISGQKISQSGMNLEDKAELARSWDIHAERALACTDCHYALNNPIYYQPPEGATLESLTFDPRRLTIGEYLHRPNHDFARGESAQFTVDAENRGTMRRCESCHDADATHADWLPYTTQHMEAVACESCHIPQMYAPAIQSYDWTVVNLEGEASTSCRGVQGSPDSLSSLVTGFEPVLIQRTNVDGDSMLAPYNLVTSWYWTYEDAKGSTLPVRQIDLQAAYLANGQYAPDVLAAFDANGDGKMNKSELVLDTPEKVALITSRLEGLGLNNVQIMGSVQPYSINHNVAGEGYATKECTTCHGEDSQLTQPMKLANAIPGGVMPVFVSDTNVAASGEIYTDDSGALYYRMDPKTEKLYIFGHSRVGWVDWVGGLAVLGVLAGAGGHGLLRFLSGRKYKHAAGTIRKEYMYQVYERFWHWLQTVLIVILLITGLFIHRPEIFGVSFRGLVTIHNVSAVILALNAVFSLFYHLTTGQVRQFLPRPRGFFDDAIVQAKFYLNGIFKRQAHPFEKTPERKLNPLQQITYLGILNVLLPLQGLTGILMWGAQQWPDLTARLGGLTWLAPLHSLVAWLFAAFIILHVYLTTTSGPKPLDSIKAMVTGWEDVEEHAPQAEEAAPAQDKA